jgi:site-specific DNA-methyltransferase (adenine-specific)
VRCAASRKYLTQDPQWYFPPPEALEALADYANAHGDPAGRPYFALRDCLSPTGSWQTLRARFHCRVGVTNVWREPAVRGKERIKRGGKAVHPSQKPLRLMRRVVRASSDPGDLVWEPFGGLCTGAVAAHALGRRSVSAEVEQALYTAAVRRLRGYDRVRERPR